MHIKSVCSVALRSLQRAPVRSSLTALGIIVGVAAVVTTSSIGNGARHAIEETLAKQEARTIYVSAFSPPSKFRRLGAKLPLGDGIQSGDYFAIRTEVRDLSALSPRIYVTTQSASANGRSANAVLDGIDVDGFAINSRTLLNGALFSARDVARAANVCVISESLANTLFPSEQPIGRSIRLNDRAFQIVGVVDDNSGQTFLGSMDLHVYLPFTSVLRRIDTTAPIGLTAQVSDVTHIGLAQQQIRDVLERRRSSRTAAFLTSTSFDSIKAYVDGSRNVARLLGAIGAISLIVGGIGITNIMLVGVKERTREIGLRIAVGTRSRDILAQFLTEAIVLSVLGGIVGLVIGWIASVVVTQVNDWPTEVTMSSVVTALVCSAGVGAFFGYYPARRAALMQPIEALRAEN